MRKSPGHGAVSRPTTQLDGAAAAGTAGSVATAALTYASARPEVPASPEMVHISPAPARRPAAEDFAVVYAALAEHVLADAEARGRQDVSLLPPALATASGAAIPREVLMALPDREFVESCFLLVLDRPASAKEVSGRVARLGDGTLERQALLDSLTGSLEAARAGRTVRFV